MSFWTEAKNVVNKTTNIATGGVLKTLTDVVNKGENVGSAFAKNVIPEEIWSEKGGWGGQKAAKNTATQAKAAEKATKEKKIETTKSTQKVEDDAATKAYSETLSKETGKIDESMKKAVKAGGAAGQAYKDATDSLIKQTQGLSKWQEGLVTSYEGIASKYKAAFDESERQRNIESQTAQRDYGSNAALMSRAAAVGMQGQGPMTGGQQQMMMATAQQQATSAYATAQDRIAANDATRKELGSRVVQNTLAQQANNAQIGYGQQAGMIQAQNTLYGQNYGTSMSQISDQYNSDVYQPTANIANANSTNQMSLAMRGLREGVAGSQQQLLAMQSMPQAQGQSTMAKMLGGAATGAATGSLFGVGYGTAIGGIAGAFMGAAS